MEETPSRVTITNLSPAPPVNATMRELRAFVLSCDAMTDDAFVMVSLLNEGTGHQFALEAFQDWTPGAIDSWNDLMPVDVLLTPDNLEIIKRRISDWIIEARDADDIPAKRHNKRG